ncbi:MAG: hypothetical protein JKY57_04050 [Kordiimonadaceae bacterium]|nr:hypothetical protein [Kordiimonadaceae bacterium]
MSTCTLLDRLNAGETVFGLFSPYSDVCLAQMAASTGADFIIFDAEHGYVSDLDIPGLALAAEREDCTALVRVPQIEPRTIGRFLDNGAAGIVAPMVNSAADAKALKEALYYPPKGSRGLAPTKNMGFVLGDAVATQILQANNSVLSIAQIETKEAVENLDEILMDENLNVIFVGPADLSTSLGHAMDFDNPMVISTLMEVAQKVNASDKHLGILAQTSEQIQMTHMMGARFIAGYIDTVISTGCQSYLTGARTVIEQQGG